MTPGNKKTTFWRIVAYPVLISTFVFLLSVLSPLQALAQPTNPSTTPPAGQQAPQNNTDTTCAIEKVGWIVCPVTEAAATIGDKLFSFLADNFLQTEPELVSSQQGNGTIAAWEIARNLANVMFIIAFLIIIYSQVTGAGISNYGLKRMLPRLIIAAIAVNVSYYICQGMVDISNILGYEIKNALVNIANQVSTQHALAPTNQGTNTQTSDGALGTLAKAILGAAAVVWILYAIFGPLLGMIVITCIIIIIILLMRKAFIVLLVVISPIAFVMYLLPNTEKFFSKWLNMFWQLLMVFPVVALLFGGGQLASAIILSAGMSSANANNANPNNAVLYKVEGEGCINLQQVADNNNPGAQVNPQTTTQAGAQCGTQDGPGWMLAMVAAGIAVAPLLAVWSVLKGALSAAGAIGGKIAGAVQSGTTTGVNKIGKPLGLGRDALKKRAGEDIKAGWQRMQARGLEDIQDGGTGGLAGRYARRSAARAKRHALSKEGLETAQRQEIDRQLVNDDPSGILAGMSEAGQQRAIRGAQASTDKLQAEELQAASITARDMSNADLNAIVSGAGTGADEVNDPRVAAAIQELAQRQDFEGLERAINKFGQNAHGIDASGNPTAQANLITRTLASSISQNNPGFFTAGNIGDIARGAVQGNAADAYQRMAAQNIANGAFSAEKMAEAGPSALQEASFIAGRAGGGTHRVLTDAANELLADTRLVGKLSRNRNVVGDMSIGTIRRSR